MQTGSRESSDAEGPPDPPTSMPRHPVWIAVAAATAGGWVGMIVSVLGWFDEPLVVWFHVSTVTTAVGACGGLGLAATMTAIRLQRRRADQEETRTAEYDARSSRHG